MNIEANTDLIPLDAPPLAQLFHQATTMGVLLKKIERTVLAETADVETEEGRASIKSLAHKVSRSKTALEAIGKPLADKAREEYDKINAIRKTAKDTLDALRDKVRKPVSDWDEVEKQRVEALEDRLTAISSLREFDRTCGSAGINTAINSLHDLNVFSKDWGEFEERATDEKAASLEHLTRVLAEAREDEAKEAELEALRAEKLEREAQDAERDREARIAEREMVAADNAKRIAEFEAEAALEREKDRNQREFDQAQREVAEANQRAADAVQAERQRIASDRRIEDAKQRDREANVEHRKRIMEAVASALTPYVLVGIADEITDAIEAGKIHHVTINF